MKYLMWAWFYVCGYFTYPRVQEVGWKQVVIDGAWWTGITLLGWFALWATIQAINKHRVPTVGKERR